MTLENAATATVSSSASDAPNMLSLLSHIAYGGDYSPEQWDDATLAEDLDLMTQFGVNLVSLGVFSWARLEPSDGEYAFDWLERIIDALHERGISVDLATGTASPPAWLTAEHPQILPVTAQGVRLGVGSRQHTCLSSPYLREKQAALAGALAQRFGDQPGVVLWHVNNEYGCHVHECFCDQCAQAFRTWLQERYTSIDTLNAEWGTAFWSQTYSQWEQVNPPAAMPTFAHPAQVVDWRRFCDAQMRAMYLNEYQAIREYSQRPITTNFMGSFPWLDHYEWAKVVDVVSTDTYPDPADPAAAWECAWSGDLERSLAGGPWLLMEQAPSAVQWRRRNSPKRPGQFALWSLSALARGADGILQFQWRQSLQGAETFHSGMVPHAGIQSRTFHEAQSFGATLARLDSVRGSHSSADIAIVMDWPSEWARLAAVGPAERGEHFAEARAWHHTLWEAGHTVDLVPVSADFSAYRLVVVPGVFIDYPQMSQALTRAAQAGTQVLVTCPTGVVDSSSRAVQGGYLGSLAELLGVHVIDHHLLSGPVRNEDERAALTHRISRAVGTPGSETWTGLHAVTPSLQRLLDRMAKPAPDLRGGRWAEEIALHLREQPTTPEGISAIAFPDLWPSLDTDVEAIAVFDGRGGSVDLAARAAITRRPVSPASDSAASGVSGRGGAAWYVAADLDSLSRSALAELLTLHARIRPTMPGLPDGVEAVRRGQHLFLLNHSDRAVELSGVVGRDLVSGGQCTGHVMLAPRSGMVVQPEKDVL